MISLKNGLPLVRGCEGASATFDLAWLRSTLAWAAVKAGYQGWWLADDIAVGISVYLRDDYSSSVIDLSKLETVVQSVLCEVGYSEVASCFRTVMPYHRISLAQCLRQLSQNDQEEFFAKLSEEITRLNKTKPQHIHFSDLQACVRGLERLHNSADDVETTSMLYKVVAFVRDHVQSMRWHPQVRCSIS